MVPRFSGSQVIIALLITLSGIIYFHSSNAQWIRQSPVPTHKLLRDICFIDHSTGWVFGDDGAVFRTDDSGDTWADQSIDTYFEVLQGIFLDHDTGWIAVSSDQQDAWGYIYKTVNGGNSWDQQYFDQISAILDLSFINHDTGWALALCNRQYPAEIHKNFFLKTTDGGENWSLLDSIDQYGAVRIQFLNDTLGYLACKYDPVLMKTTDGGMTWQDAPHIAEGSLTDVYFTDPLNGFTSGDDFYFTHDAGLTWDYTASSEMKSVEAYDASNGWAISYHDIYKFLDGGDALQLQYQVNKSYLEAISVVDDSNAYIVGRNVCIFSTNDGGQFWQEKSNGTHLDLYSVFFLDENLGWAGGDGDNNGGVMHMTTDGGEHWTRFTGFLPGYNIIDIQFVNPLKGWLADGYVYRTTNGGQSWSQTLGNQVWIQDLNFVNDLLGWCVGRGGDVYKTINGGSNWNLQSAGTDKDLNAVCFVNENTGWIAGEQIIMKTTDGGETWEESYVGYSEFFKIQFFDENTGYVLAVDLYLKTYTGGEYWHTVNNYELGEYLYFEDMCFTSPETGFLSGNKFLFKTSDGGNTWLEEPEFPGLYSNAVYFTDEMNGWIVGDDGGIFHTTTGGSVGIDDSETIPGTADLRIFPNPAKNQVQICFQTPGNREAAIEIYSMTGERVFYKLMKDLPPGEHSVTWDPELLPSGIYLCRTNSGSFVATEKIVLIK